ncbi:MAG: hypothetical protein ACLRU1_05890 [Veillonella parvula]
MLSVRQDPSIMGGIVIK